MKPSVIEEHLRYYNYLIILNGRIRKVYLVDCKYTTVDKIQIEIAKISPDLALIINKNDSTFLSVVNTTKISQEDIDFLQNVSASIFERMEKNEDVKLGNLLGYACPMTPPETPLRMNILFTVSIVGIGTITLFNFVCVLTQQNFQRSNDLLADVNEALLSTGVIVIMYIEGLKKRIHSSQLKVSALPNEPMPMPPTPHRHFSEHDSDNDDDKNDYIDLPAIEIQVLSKDGKGIKKKTNKRRNKRSRKDKRKKKK